MFHRLHDPGAFAFAPNRQNCVTPVRFRNLLSELAADDIDVLDLDTAAERVGAETRRRFVCLTFDDGYRDNHDTLLPIVRDYAVPVTVFVTPGLVDGTAPLWWYALDEIVARERLVCLPLDGEAELPAGTEAEKAKAFATVAAFMLRARAQDTDAVTAALSSRYGADYPALARTHMMDWKMVRALAACPLVTVGAHTMTHPPLARRTALEAGREMACSRDRLQAETGQPVRHLAYPFGTSEAAGPREFAMAAELGFATALTSRPGHPVRGAPRMSWPRVGIGPGDSAGRVRLKLLGAAALRARLSAVRQLA